MASESARVKNPSGGCPTGHDPTERAVSETYAEELLDDLGIDVEAIGPEHLQPYISFDLAAFARDLSFDLHAAEDDDGVYLFEP